jgi:hypothetical protein
MMYDAEEKIYKKARTDKWSVLTHFCVVSTTRGFIRFVWDELFLLSSLWVWCMVLFEIEGRICFPREDPFTAVAPYFICPVISPARP